MAKYAHALLGTGWDGGRGAFLTERAVLRSHVSQQAVSSDEASVHEAQTKQVSVPPPRRGLPRAVAFPRRAVHPARHGGRIVSFSYAFECFFKAIS